MTEWFDREAGSPVAQSQTDPSMLLVSGGREKPDWIGIPDEIGGGRVRCAAMEIRPCICGEDHVVPHFVLEGKDLRVAECPSGGFLWYRLRAEAQDSGE